MIGFSLNETQEIQMTNYVFDTIDDLPEAEDLEVGDVLFLTITNDTDATNITHRHGSLNFTKTDD